MRDIVTSLNSMYAGDEFVGDFSKQPLKPTLAQATCLHRFRDAVRSLGKPPDDLSGRGALVDLQAKLGYSGEPASLAPFNGELVSLPPVGGSPSSLTAILGPEAESVVKVLRQKMVSPNEAGDFKREAGLKAPYFDPKLKHCRVSYVQFLRRLEAAGLVEYRLHVREQVGLFCVWKKSGKQRLIVDARLSNCWFGASSKVSLATGASFAALDVDPGPPIEVGGVDIADAFYQIELPTEFRDLFGLRPVQAGEVDLWTLGGRPVSPTQKVFPVFKAVPMGWTHALWICQQCHEHVVNSIPKLPASLRLVDGKPAPHMRPFVHTEYVDNFVALSQRQGLVKELATEVQGALQERGLPTHEVESSGGWRHARLALQ